MTHSTSEPTGCDSCASESAEQGWGQFRRLNVVKSLVNESHFAIRVSQCKNCQQRYLSVFSERIDWEKGEDPQQWHIIPLSSAELEQLAVERDENELIAQIKKLAAGRKSLYFDWPSGRDPVIIWSSGIVFSHHD